MRSAIRNTINTLLGHASVRLVNAQWGPRGFESAFERLRKLGVSPRQIVDVGASDGVWTHQCMAIFPAANYFLVDPLEENRAKLELLTGKRAGISFWHGALGAAAGKLPLHAHGDQSSFLASEYDSQNNATRWVDVRMLDSFLGNELVQPPDLVKVDVQGYELEVLKGAEECMKSAEVLLLEVSYRRVYDGCPLAHEVISFVGQRGFRIYDICTYAQCPRDKELFQSDIVFVKDGSRVFEFEGYA